MENIHEVIDPVQIIKISINKIKNNEKLCLFTNLKSLSIEKGDVVFKTFITFMRCLD